MKNDKQNQLFKINIKNSLQLEYFIDDFMIKLRFKIQQKYNILQNTTFLLVKQHNRHINISFIDPKVQPQRLNLLKFKELKNSKLSYLIMNTDKNFIHNPFHGLYTPLKNSTQLIKNVQSSSKLQFITESHKFQNIHPSYQYQLQYPTTYDNSLATKDERVTKSMLNIDLSSKSYSKDSKNQSLNKRKKFISITQRSNEKVHNSQKKSVSSQINSHIFGSQRKVAFKQNESQKKDLSIKDFTSPSKSFKQYLGTMINSIVYDHKVEDGQNKDKGKVQEKVLNEDIMNFNDREFSLTQKARIQRKNMMSALLLHDKQTQRKQNRLFTQNRKDQFTPLRNQIQATQPDYTYNQRLCPEYRPQCFYDSRNFMVFQQKIGQNTLTRKDSLILALMENLYLEGDCISDKFIDMHQHQQHLSPLTLQKEARKSISLIQKEQQMPLLSHKLKDKIYSEQQKIRVAKQKPSKIKFISLIQKQQSHRYKNFMNQNVIKDQFTNLQRKTQRNK